MVRSLQTSKQKKKTTHDQPDDACTILTAHLMRTIWRIYNMRQSKLLSGLNWRICGPVNCRAVFLR